MEMLVEKILANGIFYQIKNIQKNESEEEKLVLL